MHIPVLINEAIETLDLSGKSIFIDWTLWLWGHSKEILKKYPQIKLIWIDQDEKNIEIAQKNLEEFWDRVKIVHDNFANIEEIIKNLDLVWKIDWILLDIWVASTHFDQWERWFAFQIDWPLDMRMDTNTIKTAKEVLNKYKEQDLFLIFKKYWEEPNSRKLARIICEERKIKKLETTWDLKKIICDNIPEKFRNWVLKKIFQAIRIEVNDELLVLEKWVFWWVNILKKWWRIAIISYHSLEDRIVKQAFKQEEKECICPQILPICQCEKIKRLEIKNKKPIMSKEEEVKSNPRSRSAKMRVAEKIV